MIGDDEKRPVAENREHVLLGRKIFETTSLRHFKQGTHFEPIYPYPVVSVNSSQEADMTFASRWTALHSLHPIPIYFHSKKIAGRSKEACCSPLTTIRLARGEISHNNRIVAGDAHQFAGE